MREREPMTQTINASDARQQWSRILNQVFRGETRVLVEKSGIPVAAIISAEDLVTFKKLEAYRREQFKALEDTWEAFQDVPPEEIEQEVTRALAQVREKRRQQKRSESSA